MLTNEKHEGIIEYYGANGVHATGAYRYWTIQVPTGQFYANGGQILQDLNVANAVTMYSAATDYSQISEIDMFPNGTLALYANNATLSNVTVWSADSILTQGRGDGRYIQNGTLANVALSGNYNDLNNKPSAYTLPAATNMTLGGIIVGSNLTISNGVLSAISSGGSGGGIFDGGSALSSDNTFDGGSATGN